MGPHIMEVVQVLARSLRLIPMAQALRIFIISIFTVLILKRGLCCQAIHYMGRPITNPSTAMELYSRLIRMAVILPIFIFLMLLAKMGLAQRRGWYYRVARYMARRN